MNNRGNRNFMMTSTSLRGRGHAPRAAAAAAAAFVAAAPSLIAVAFVAFFAVAFFSAFAFLTVAAAAAAASLIAATAAVAIAPRLRRRFLATLALLGRVHDLSLLGLEALGLALELPVLLVRLLLGGGGGGGHGGGGDGAGDGPQTSPIGPRRGLRLLSAGLSGPGVLRGALQVPVTEKGARAEGTLPFISQPASSLSLRQLRGSQPRGERESKDGAPAVASGPPSSLIRSPPLRRSLHPASTAAGRDRILSPRLPAP